MFQYAGQAIVRCSPCWVLGWLLVWGATEYWAPEWRTVARDDEFGFLPPDSPSRISDELFALAFPDEKLGSTVVVLLRRPSGPDYGPDDKRFVDEVLEPKLRQLAEADGGLASEATLKEASPFDEPATPVRATRSIMSRIRTPTTPGVGSLLVSGDRRAWMVVVELTSDFLSNRNGTVVGPIEELSRSLVSQAPAGTELYLTGSAVLGRDRIKAQVDSAHATERWTVILVIGLLILIYRAPLLTVIPLLTVFLSVRVALNLLAIMAAAGWVTVFEGIQIYVTIVAYGAGVDYCLFLTARYREELDQSADYGAGMAKTIGHIGGALTASAATVMGGIGMMVFAQFGKFHLAGIAMPLSILIVLLATLTFAAALLRFLGRWAFWPYHAQTTAEADSSGLLATGFVAQRWQWLADQLTRRPGLIGSVTAALMVPFALGGVLLRDQQTYDLVRGLPGEAASVRGTEVLATHFPPGLMGPVSVLLVNPAADFSTAADEASIAALTARLAERRIELGLADVRTLTSPLGITESARKGLEREGLTQETMPETLRQDLLARYTTDFGERRRTGTRIELILQDNPFARQSLDRLGNLETAVGEALPPELSAAQLHFSGVTASMSDLRSVNRSDQIRIEVLVLAVVFLILWVLLRGFVVSVYLMISVLFSYYATLGVAYGVFWLLAPNDFAGLDWKVGIFLFTILIAVGEDYNIFLLSRVREEQSRFGPVRGVAEALIRTGPIISSCGLIMAGTFASLMMGSLEEMKQLGFALAFGVLLDTFVVRPILVPAFLIGLERWRHWLKLQRQPDGSQQVVA